MALNIRYVLVNEKKGIILSIGEYLSGVGIVWSSDCMDIDFIAATHTKEEADKIIDYLHNNKDYTEHHGTTTKAVEVIPDLIDNMVSRKHLASRLICTPFREC